VSQQPNLEIVERTSDGVSARLTGDLDIVNAEDVKRELTELVDSGPEALTLDMEAVRFVDSSGLGTLVAIHRHAESAGARFVVRSVPAQVLRLFEITRLDDLLAVED
jgi:anti-sigma B factor antagonist